MRGFGLLMPIAALVACPPAAARVHAASPGNSGVDQYVESLPTANGDQPVRVQPHRSPPPALTVRTRHELDAFGTEGRGVEVLAAQTTRRGAAASRPRRRLAAGPAISTGGALTRALTDSGAGGMGLLFPLLMGGSLGGAIAFRRSIRRRR